MRRMQSGEAIPGRRRPEVFLLMALGLAGFVAVAAAPREGRLEEVTVHGRSLEGNLLGLPADRAVSIYTPPGYGRGRNRYPTLYLLHGIQDTNRTWTRSWGPGHEGFDTIQALMDRGIDAGLLREMIVVIPDAEKTCHYTDSPVKGGWGSFIARDLVAFVDRSYRTVPSSEGRAILGHSMGGHGAIKLAMTHPGVFSVVYALNPSLLGWGGDVSPENPAFAEVARLTGPDDLARASFYAQAIVGIGQCFSPDPRAPLLTQLPFPASAQGELVAGEARERWSAQMPIAMVEKHAGALKALRGLRFDSAFEDEFSHIPQTSRALSEALTKAGVEHTFEMYNGDHRNRLWGAQGRLYAEALPWISRLLDDGSSAKPAPRAGAPASHAGDPGGAPADAGAAQVRLWEAAQSGDLAAARAAAEAGADLNALDTRTNLNGRRALNYAALNNRVEMIRWLVASGARINLANNTGYTPLHHAAESGSLEAAQALMELGADPKAINKPGHTPLATARRFGQRAVAEYLERASGS